VNNDKEINNLLKRYNLRVTAVRKSVLNLFTDHLKKGLSHNFIEKALNNSDRVTLYRTLKSFEEKGLIHEANDGSGTIKYALCSSACNHLQHFDNHAHFYCNNCNETFCLDNTRLEFSAPNGFQLTETQIVMKGLCNNCAVK